MKFEIYFKNRISFEKGWPELEMLSSQLIGDMKLTKGNSFFSGEFAIVELEEFADTAALMKTLKEMANKEIHWHLIADWWSNKED